MASSSESTAKVMWLDQAAGHPLAETKTFKVDPYNTLKKKVERKSKSKRDAQTQEIIKKSEQSYESRKTNPLSHMFARERRKNFQGRKKYPISEPDYQFHYCDIIESYRLLHIHMTMMRTLLTQDEQVKRAKELLESNLLFTTFLNKAFMRSFLLTPCIDEHMKQVVIWLNSGKGSDDLKLLGERIEKAVSRVAFRKGMYLQNIFLFKEFENMVELRHHLTDQELIDRVGILKQESERFKYFFDEISQLEGSIVGFLRSKKYREFLSDLWKGYEEEYFK